MVLLLSNSVAFTQGIKGWFDINNGSAKNYEDGEVTTKSHTFNRNLYLGITKPVTSALSYQLNFRTNMSDNKNVDATGDTVKYYKRSLEPALDVYLRNPMYNIAVGFRRQEEWSTAHMNNEGRETTDFAYSRFNVSPEDLPSLNLQLDWDDKFDYLDESNIDSTSRAYTINSSYELPSRDLDVRYTANYSNTVNKNPLNQTNKTIQDNFNSSYNLGYKGDYWNNRVRYSIGYQGNYLRTKNEQFVTQTGTILNERIPTAGLYDPGASADVNDVSVLTTALGSLVNDNTDVSTGIDLTANQFHNLGILVSSAKAVDRIYIYVNQNVGADALNSTANWTIAKSDFNQAGTWSSVPITSVAVTVVDLTNNIYRFEIKFASSHNASYFKAINEVVSTVAGTEVTEMEAFGEDIADDELLVDVTTSYSQQLNLTALLESSDKLNFTLNYSIDRSDQNPASILDSMSGIVGNIFSDSLGEDKSGFSSQVSRNYGITSTWFTHRILTTVFRINRSESFNDKKETDTASNTYNLSFTSDPLPTVDASLSLIRNDSFSFGEKRSTNNSAVLSVGSKLYRDVNMITDLGFTRSNSFESDVTTSSRQINATIDAVITKKVSSMVSYGSSWSSSDGDSTRSSDGSATITYRPGRFVNISSMFSAADSDGDVTTSESFLIDWLPVPAVRLNMNYRHSDSDPGPVKTDTLSGYVVWYLTKFADLRTTYSYTKKVEDTETESVAINSSLNCRF